MYTNIMPKHISLFSITALALLTACSGPESTTVTDSVGIGNGVGTNENTVLESNTPVILAAESTPTVNDSSMPNGTDLISSDNNPIALVDDNDTNEANVELIELAPQATINIDNYEAVLTQAFEVYLGTAYDKRIPTSNLGPIRTNALQLPIEAGYGDNLGIYHCSNGGMVIFNGEFIADISSLSYTATECQYNDTVFNGTVAWAGRRETTHGFLYVTDYSAHFGSSDQLTIDGQYRRAQGFYGYNNGQYNWTEHWRTDSLDYFIRYLGDELIISNATTNAWYGYAGRIRTGEEYFWVYRASVQGEFEMQIPGSDNIITASVPQRLFNEYQVAMTDEEVNTVRRPYVMPPIPTFTEGELVLAAADGSSLRFTAYDDMPPTVTLETEGSTQELVVDWANFTAALTIRGIIHFPE